jgi:hypothetical protein
MHFATLRQPEGPGGVAEPDLIDSEKARKLNRNTEEDGGER